MAAGALAWAGLGWWTASTVLHWATAILAGQRRPPPDRLSAVNHSPADFSIVTPLPVAVEGGLNVLGDPKAVSITAQNVFAVPLGW